MSIIRIITLIFIFALSQKIIAQQNKTIYLLFDSKSNEICNIPKSEQGRYHGDTKAKRFLKINTNINEVKFYICKERFLLYSNSKNDTCSVKFIEKIKISDIFELKKIVNKENPLYPYKVFKNIFLIEKINDSTFVKYKVKWQYYIE